MSGLLKIHKENPELRKLNRIVEIIKQGGIIIYPTDTLYALGCDITNNKAIEKIAKIKGIDTKKANFSFIIKDLSRINDYAKPFSNRVYKLMKKNLPGPFTFILKANNSIPKMLKNNKKTIGIRIPGSNIATDIVDLLNTPLMSSSIKNIEDGFVTYPNDPYEIFEKYKYLVDIMIDGGVGGIEPSTVIDCTGDDIEIVRQGRGELLY